MMTSTDIRIGLWGTSGSGKTTFIAMLYHIYTSLHDQWDIEAAPDSPQAIAFVRQSFETIFTQKSFPEKTVETREYTFIITNLSNKQKFRLTLIDAPGELYERYYDQTSRADKQIIAQSTTTERQSDLTPEDVFKKISQCHGLMMFIDPAWQTSAKRQGSVGYDRLLFDILSDLRFHQRQTGKNPPLIALCMTKSDGNKDLYIRGIPPIDSCYRATAETSPAIPSCAGKCPIFDEIGVVTMRDHIPHLHPYHHTRCFLISSIGRTHDANNSNVSTQRVWNRPLTPLPPRFSGDEALFSDYQPELMPYDTHEPNSICDPNSINPQNLLEPLNWMISDLANKTAESTL